MRSIKAIAFILFTLLLSISANAVQTPMDVSKLVMQELVAELALVEGITTQELTATQSFHLYNQKLTNVIEDHFRNNPEHIQALIRGRQNAGESLAEFAKRNADELHISVKQLRYTTTQDLNRYMMGNLRIHEDLVRVFSEEQTQAIARFKSSWAEGVLGLSENCSYVEYEYLSSFKAADARRQAMQMASRGKDGSVSRAYKKYILEKAQSETSLLGKVLKALL